MSFQLQGVWCLLWSFYTWKQNSLRVKEENISDNNCIATHLQTNSYRKLKNHTWRLISTSNYKDKQNKDRVKNNLNSLPFSKNDQYHIQKYMPHKYGKATNEKAIKSMTIQHFTIPELKNYTNRCHKFHPKQRT